MAKYTVRITNDEEGINAWIDQDGLICIKQPCAPDKTGQWATEAEAKTWADAHAAQLEEQHLAGLEAIRKEQELKDTQLAALQAQIQSAADLKAILEKLTNPTA
jgi:hypothetical protein